MALTPLRLVLFIFGLLVTVAGVGYFSGYLETPSYKQFVARFTGGEKRAETADGTLIAAQKPAEAVAEAPVADATAKNPQDADVAAVQPEALPEDEGKAATTTVTAETQPEAKPEEQVAGPVIAPEFHLLRVEPDGSVTIAGAAQPESSVEIVSGATILATTPVDKSGDFVAVLDDALKPGDYSIVLRSTAQDKSASTSTQTAIVSVPSTPSGQVVALVQEPGQPSRLISVPEAAPADVAAVDEHKAGDPAAETVVAQAPAASTAPVVDTEVKPEEKKADAVTTTDTAPESDKNVAAAPAAAPEKQDAPAAEAPVAVAPSTEAPDTEALDAEARATATPAQTAGEAASPAAQEPVQATTPVEGPAPVAEKPVEATRPEPIAGVTPLQPRDDAEKKVETTPFIEAVEIDGRDIFVAGRAEAGRRARVYVNDILLGQTTVEPNGHFLIQTQRDLPAGDYIIRLDVLGPDAAVVARAAVPFSREASEQQAAVAAVDAAVAPKPDVAETPVVTPSTPETTPVVKPTQELPIAQTPEAPKASETVKQDAPKAETPPATTTPVAVAPAPAAPVASPAETVDKTVMAPALKPAEGAVIIRRGDTLWHISRRVYGHGMRYTTIYLANQEQIHDPDRIWPGQVFALPSETPQGEKADLTVIEERAQTNH